MYYLRAEQLERAAQNHGGGDAVHVVITVDRDLLLPLDRRQDAIDGHRHVRQLERIVQVIQRRMQEPVSEIRLTDTADRQQPRHRRADPQRRRQSRRGLLIAGQTLP